MSRPDESLIRDADLRAELESLRSRAFGPLFEVSVRSLITTQENRDKDRARVDQRSAELAAMPREKRRRSMIREVIETSAPTPADIRHLHSVLAICGMPYQRQPLTVREFERKQSNMALDISAGFLRNANGEKVIQPLPFGPKARLVMMHLCSEAIRQKSPTVDIADSFTAFVKDMGFPDSGGRKGPLTAFKEQINALAACTMRVSVWNGTQARSKVLNPFDEVEVWLASHPDQRSLWPSTVTFNQTFFQSLQERALPLNAHVVRALAGSARKLDLYFWIGYRLYNIRSPLVISWNALADQFGQGYARPRDFRAAIAEDLRHICEVLPKLPLSVNETGIRLQPAGPEVLALPAPRARKKS